MEYDWAISKKLSLVAKSYVPLLLFVVFVLVESYSKFVRYQGHETDAQKIVKAIFLACLFAAIIYRFRQNAIWIKRLLLLVGAFSFGQWFIDPSFSINNLVTFSRFAFPIILFTFFTTYSLTLKGRQKLFKAFEWFLALNFVLIVIGLIADVYVLKTYTGSRFGYNGLLLTSSTSTYVYFCALGYFYFVFKREMFQKWQFWAVVISCFLVGTKSLYLGMFLFALLVVFDSTFKYKKLLLSIGTIATILGLYVILYHVPQFSQIRQDEGILTSLLSYRDQLFLDQTLPYIQENWELVNYLFGGVKDFTLRSQMDFVDLFFFWGICGALLYLFIYGKTFFSFKLKRVHIFYFVSLGGIVFIAGNFFTYTSVPLYLVLVREAILYQTKTFD